MTILLLPEVRQYLKDLAYNLYDKFYFGFEDSAHYYVEELLTEIQKDLPNKLKKPAPPYFSKYGKNMYFTVFKKNKDTSWYVFFTIHDDIYLIRYIGNNYNCAQHIR